MNKMKIEFETENGILESFDVDICDEDQGLIVLEKEYALSFSFKAGYQVWKRVGNVICATLVPVKWLKLEIQHCV